MSHRANQFRGREADEGGPFGIAVALDAYRNKRSPIEIREKNDEKKKKAKERFAPIVNQRRPVAYRIRRCSSGMEVLRPDHCFLRFVKGERAASDYFIESRLPGRMDRAGKRGNSKGGYRRHIVGQVPIGIVRRHLEEGVDFEISFLSPDEEFIYGVTKIRLGPGAHDFNDIFGLCQL